MTGKVRINYRDGLPGDLAARLTQAVGLLISYEIEVLLRQSPSAHEADLVIDMIEMGDISDLHIRPFLLTLFPLERKVKGVTAIVRDLEGQKQFNIPDEFDECVDWFRME